MKPVDKQRMKELLKIKEIVLAEGKAPASRREEGGIK